MANHDPIPTAPHNHAQTTPALVTTTTASTTPTPAHRRRGNDHNAPDAHAATPPHSDAHDPGTRNNGNDGEGDDHDDDDDGDDRRATRTETTQQRRNYEHDATHLDREGLWSHTAEVPRLHHGGSSVRASRPTQRLQPTLGAPLGPHHDRRSPRPHRHQVPSPGPRLREDTSPDMVGAAR